MNRIFYSLLILLLPFVFSNCQEQKKVIQAKKDVSIENDTLIPFSIDLVKKLDNKIQWNRIEFDSTTSRSIEIHRPIYSNCDKNTFIESVKDINLFKYFTKNELNQSTDCSLDYEVIKQYNTIGDDVVVIDGNTIKYWYQESDRILLKNPKAIIPLSFQWYFGISDPVLSENGKYIYFELFECNIDKEVFWIYVFKKENAGWKRFYVKRIGVKIA